jgi:hypothetical protein
MQNKVFLMLALLIPALTQAEYTVEAGPDWQPIEIQYSIEPDSALDFSARTDAPAGKYGRVLATEDGHFVFKKRPKEPVRFHGVNTCFTANFLSKPEAEALALRLRQMGYNTLRIHHYDVLVSGGWNPSSYVFDEKAMDQLDYLFYCMKEQGIYIATDLFTIRRIQPAVLQKYGLPGKFQGFKALVPLLPEAMEDWKRFATDMMTHKNPYTGMTWAEDPALFSINPVNEDTLYDFYKETPELEALANRLFDEWCEENDQDCDEETRPALFLRFLTEKHLAADREMARFLKEELGVQALLSGNNWKVYQVQTILRSEYDYVDNHRYWDHPAWSGSPTAYPIRLPQKNAVKNLAFVPRHLFLTRVPGKPFVVSEFNFCYPNQWRGQSGPLFGAYAALQDWDGLIRFNWYDGIIKDKNWPQIIRGFDMINDPVTLLSDLIVNHFWAQRQVPAFENEAVYTVTDETAFSAMPNGKPEEFPKNASLVGLTHKVGSVYENDGNAEQLNRLFLDQREQNSYRVEQDNFRVEIEKAGNFIVSTPTGIALCLNSQSLDPEFVTGFSGDSTVFCGALDFQPLEKSKRLLVLQLSNVYNSGMRMTNQMRTQENRGDLPLLVRRASADLAVPNTFDEKDISVYALDLSGKRIREIPFSVNEQSNRLEFNVQTIAEDNSTCMAYEIVRK